MGCYGGKWWRWIGYFCVRWMGVVGGKLEYCRVRFVGYVCIYLSMNWLLVGGWWGCYWGYCV